MKLTKSKLKQMIGEELLNEKLVNLSDYAHQIIKRKKLKTKLKESKFSVELIREPGRYFREDGKRGYTEKKSEAIIFKSEKEAKEFINSFDWQFRSNYKPVKI